MANRREDDSGPSGSCDDASVAVVTVNYRTPELTLRCAESLKPERRSLPRLRLIVVDGGSADSSPDQLGSALAGPAFRDWASFLSLAVNGGFGWANNQAMLMLLQQPEPPQFIHLLNPDCEIEPGAILHLVEYLRDHPRTAAVGSQLLEPDGSLTGSAFNFPTIRGEFARGARTGVIDRLLRVPPTSISASSAREVQWATGASVMFRAEAFRESGLFDEGFFLYHEEIELMWRLRRAGWAIAFEPKSRVRHVGGAATGVHSRKTDGKTEPRKPRYWYRSRTRLFALTRGKTAASLAYIAWFLGYPVWVLRRLLGLAPGAKPYANQFRDHLRYALPRRSDGMTAVRAWDDQRAQSPMWMERGWS